MSRRDFLKGMVAAGTYGVLSSAVPQSGQLGSYAAEAPGKTPAASGRWTPTDKPNQPIGVAKGILPGRVVWVRDPKAALWDGKPEIGWFDDKWTNPALAEAMLVGSLRLVSGTKTDADAWIALFRSFNSTHGRGNAGYKPGEKVVVKVNCNTCQKHTEASVKHYNTPQLTRALLRNLVRQGGVREADIVVYDASRAIPDPLFLPIHAEFPGIRFEDRMGGDGRFKVEADMKTALHFGDPKTADSGKTFLPACATAATYMINAALLKGHTIAAVTLGAKNHFGSVYRETTGASDPRSGWNPVNMHDGVTTTARKMGSPNPLVDLMGHKDLGGKTMLYLVDGLYTTPQQNAEPVRWQSPPFENLWPASIFVSQDPVAIESVCVDFFAAEKSADRLVGAADNYLHEAALAPKSPSGVRYDPAATGTPLASLGVHEHWNNADKKQYSRNLKTGEGIELVTG